MEAKKDIYEQAEQDLEQYTSMNRWFAEQIWGAENLRPVTGEQN